MKPQAARLPLLYALTFALVTAGCGADQELPDETRAGTVLDHFDARPVILQEPMGDLIGEIKFVSELRSGNLLVSDRFKPRIHMFDTAGVHLSSAGKSGEGPGEFRGIFGAAQAPNGEIHVVDSQTGRVTVLSEDTLGLVRTYRPPVPPLGPVGFLDGDLITAAMAGRGSERVHRVRGDSILLWSASPMPAEVRTQPYWINFADVQLASVGDAVVLGSGILYPLEMVSAAGQVTSFGHPPPAFRPIPRVELNAFPNGPRGKEFEEFLASFDVVAGIFPLDGEHVAVVHGGHEPHPLAFTLLNHQSVDIYRIGDTSKVLEGLSLPDGWRVVGGGRHLYMVSSQPPDPWVIMRSSPKSGLAVRSPGDE